MGGSASGEIFSWNFDGRFEVVKWLWRFWRVWMDFGVIFALKNSKILNLLFLRFFNENLVLKLFLTWTPVKIPLES